MCTLPLKTCRAIVPPIPTRLAAPVHTSAARKSCPIIKLEVGSSNAFKRGMYQYQKPRRDRHPRCSDCGEVMELRGAVQEERRPDAVILVYQCPSGHTHEIAARRVKAAA